MRNKILSFRVTAFFCLLCIALLGTVSPAFAQEGKKITGHVVDDTNEPHRVGHRIRIQRLQLL